MNVDAFAETFFEDFIVHFPCDDLRVSALKVGLEHYISGVGYEELTDVWEGYLCCH